MGTDFTWNKKVRNVSVEILARLTVCHVAGENFHAVSESEPGSLSLSLFLNGSILCVCVFK